MDLLLFTLTGPEKNYKIIECDEQIDRLHVLTTLTIWLTGRWSSVGVKLTLTNGQGFLQRAHTLNQTINHVVKSVQRALIKLNLLHLKLH